MHGDARNASDAVWREIMELRAENEELRRGFAAAARVMEALAAPGGTGDELAPRRRGQGGGDARWGGIVLPFGALKREGRRRHAPGR